MAALDFQVDNVVYNTEVADKVIGKRSTKIDYHKTNLGEANYRQACKLIAIQLEAGKITVPTARKLLAQAERRLRVHRPAISAEVGAYSTKHTPKRAQRGVTKFGAVSKLAGNTTQGMSAVVGSRSTAMGRVKVKRGGSSPF